MSIVETKLTKAVTVEQRVFGETVTYKVAGADPGAAITAIVSRRIPDVIEANGTREGFVWTLRVLDADVPSPKNNDTVVIGSDTWQVISEGIVSGGHRELAIASPRQTEVSADGYRA